MTAIPTKTILSTTAENQQSPSRRRRRSKVHICYSKVHNEIGTRLLLTEFKYQGVDVTDVMHNDWDLIYGGYPHCGLERGATVVGKTLPTRDRYHFKDWKMETGLNNFLLKQDIFHKLQEHQVYFPCMGCSTSYCNKHDLCRILSTINPESCFVLPDHLEVLKSKMSEATRTEQHGQPWVLKYDAPDLHAHTGKAVSFISTVDELPSDVVMSKGMHLVQPWNEPFLGEGSWRRKSELRIMVALTAVYPLRAYVYTKPYVIIAAKRYTNSIDAMHDQCMVDTHSSTKKCMLQDDNTTFLNLARENELCHRCLDYTLHAEQSGLSSNESNQILDDTYQLIAQVLKLGHHTLENHIINRGIKSTGASCFSNMRVDVGLTVNKKPFIFEFPELHNMKDNFGDVNVNVTRDLFAMIGLDAPSMPVTERADYEMKHQGGWMLLNTD